MKYLPLLLVVATLSVAFSPIHAQTPINESPQHGLYTATPTPADWHAKRLPNTFTIANWNLAHLADEPENSTADTPTRFKIQKNNLALAVNALRGDAVDVLITRNLDLYHPRTLYANQMAMLANDAYFDNTAYWRHNASQPDNTFIFSRFSISDYSTAEPYIAMLNIGGRACRVVHAQQSLNSATLQKIVADSAPVIIVSEHSQPLLGENNQWRLNAVSAKQSMYYSTDQIMVINSMIRQNPNFTDVMRVVRFEWR